MEHPKPQFAPPSAISLISTFCKGEGRKETNKRMHTNSVWRSLGKVHPSGAMCMRCAQSDKIHNFCQFLPAFVTQNLFQDVFPLNAGGWDKIRHHSEQSYLMAWMQSLVSSAYLLIFDSCMASGELPCFFCMPFAHLPQS